ncbi:hypothetical protein Tco_0642738 [Tanacetum coccineum]
MFHNLDQLWLQLERENLLEVNPRTCLEALRTQFKEFFASKRVNSSEHLNQCWQKHFKEYTFCEPNTYRRDLLENLDTLEAVIHRALQQHESLVTESTTLEANLSMDINALDVGLAVIESNKTNSYKQDTSSSSGTYITHVMDADIRPVNDQVSSPEVDSNTTSDSTNMSHRGREIDQDSEQDQVKSPLLKAEFLKMNDMVKKEVYNELSNRFLQLEKQCISLEISMQQKKESFQIVRQPNAFKSERPDFSKPRFASQVDVINVLSKPVTPHYFPKVLEYVLAKPHHLIAPGSSRNIQEEYYGSNDMAHIHYLEEARKKTQERNRNSKPSVMPSVRLQNTANGSTPNPKRTSQTSRSLPTSKSSCVTITVVPKADHSRNSSSFSDSKHFFCSTCHKCVFNANHDACITKLLNEVNSRKVKPHKTKNSNNPVEQKSHTQKPGRQISSGHRFSPKKTSAVYEKTSPRSCLRWIPTGRIFKLAGLRWIPTRKMFIDSTTKVDN